MMCTQRMAAEETMEVDEITLTPFPAIDSKKNITGIRKDKKQQQDRKCNQTIGGIDTPRNELDFEAQKKEDIGIVESLLAAMKFNYQHASAERIRKISASYKQLIRVRIPQKKQKWNILKAAKTLRNIQYFNNICQSGYDTAKKTAKAAQRRYHS